jgi:subtilisin-like proprotein convertase family protein
MAWVRRLEDKMQRRRTRLIALSAIGVLLFLAAPVAVEAVRWHQSGNTFIGYERVCTDGIKLTLGHRNSSNPITIVAKRLNAPLDANRTEVLRGQFPISERPIPNPLYPGETIRYTGEHAANWTPTLAPGTRLVLDHDGGHELYLTVGDCRRDNPPGADYPLRNVRSAVRDLPISTEVRATVVVTSELRIADINVALQIDHARVSELELDLISPSGARVRLASAMGGTADQRLGFSCLEPLIFDDESAVAVSSAAGPFNEFAYRPAQALSAFDGQRSAGEWALVIRDTNPAGNTGDLSCLSLAIGEHYTALLPLVIRS